MRQPHTFFAFTITQTEQRAHKKHGARPENFAPCFLAILPKALNSLQFCPGIKQLGRGKRQHYGRAHCDQAFPVSCRWRYIRRCTASTARFHPCRNGLAPAEVCHPFEGIVIILPHHIAGKHAAHIAQHTYHKGGRARTGCAACRAAGNGFATYHARPSAVKAST